MSILLYRCSYWLVKNMWLAEKKLYSTAPIREDIARIKERIKQVEKKLYSTFVFN